MDFTLADVHRRQLGFEIAPVLIRHPHIEPHDAGDLFVELTLPHDLQRRDANPLLHDIGQRARQRGRHRAADVGVMNVAHNEADNFTLVEHRFPDVDIGRVGRHVAGIGVVGNADVAVSVLFNQRQHRRIVDAAVPGRAEAARRGERQAAAADNLAGEIFRLFNKGGVRRAHQGKGHRIGSRGAVVRQDL